MQTKSVEKNRDGEMEASIVLSNQELILIKEAVNMYQGDVDDSNVIKIKQELKQGLHEAWVSMNPS